MNVSYIELIRALLSKAPKEGFGLTEMQIRMKILDKLDVLKPVMKGDKSQELKLEDSEAAKLSECIDLMSWGVIHKDILNFMNDMKSGCAG